MRGSNTSLPCYDTVQKGHVKRQYKSAPGNSATIKIHIHCSINPNYISWIMLIVHNQRSIHDGKQLVATNIVARTNLQ